MPDGANRFDITLKNHYHVRCIKCGEVSDVDMEEIPDLMKRIHDTHGIDFWNMIFPLKAFVRDAGEDEGGAEWIKKRCIS